MGYNLIIGELEVDYDINDGLESSIHLSAVPEKGRKESFLNVGEPTDGTNMRWPSYTSWSNFARATGLYEFFFDDCEGVIRHHPGAQPLTEEHRRIIDEKYNDFKKANPNAEPNYKYEDNVNNSILVRLEWLKYWVDWALDNCEKPVFANS